MTALEVHQPIFQTEAKFLVMYGGAGSGKSVAIAQKVILRCISTKDLCILVVRKTARTLQGSVFTLLCEHLKLNNLEFTALKSPLTIKFPSGSSIRFVGIDDPEKLKSIAGIHSIWIEEATELKLDDFLQIVLRLRDIHPTSYHQIMVSFNPTSKENWVYKYFFQEGRNDCYISKTTYLDNCFLPEHYSQSLAELKKNDENYYNVYALGEWGTLGETVYKPFRISTTFPTQFDEIIYGIDFGFNNPTAMVKIGIKDLTYYVEEFIYERKLTMDQLIQLIDVKGIDKNHQIYCDSAEPARIQDFINKGYYAIKSDKSVREGISFIHSICSNIVIHSESKNLIKENTLYKWKSRNDAFIDEPIKENDHLLDAMRYALYTRFGKGGVGFAF